MILEDEKEFKKDIILLKNNKYKSVSVKNNKRAKPSKIKNILYCLHSDLYGYSYITLTPKIYNKLRKISDIKFSYKFLDGELVDDDDKSIENDIWVKNVYYYEFARDVFSKIYEIVIAEYCLNDFFWAFDSYYSFCFSDYHISFNYNGKHFKFNNILKFYNFVFGDESLFNKCDFNDGLLSFSDKKYKFLSKKDIINKHKYNKFYKNNKDNIMMYSLHSSQFVYINPKFLRNIKSVKIKSNLYISELNGTDALDVLDSYKQNCITYTYDNYDICILYMIACAPLIVSSLTSSNCDMIKYYTKNKSMSINDKKIKKRKDKKFNTLFKHWFPGVKYGSF